jgi:hypothetical protein
MTEFTAYLRGLSYRPIEAKTIVNSFQGGEDLMLQREAANQYDANAIMVLDPETQVHLGYVAKEVAEELAPLMDEGRNFSCRVEGLAPKTCILAIHEIQVPEFAADPSFE